MQKREVLILDDAYHNFDDPLQVKSYEDISYGHNRADSIEWARRRSNEDQQIHDFIFQMRQQFRERLISEFPKEAAMSGMLADDEDLNHFFVFVGQFADMKESPKLQQMALFYAEQLKSDLNMDLHPSLFQAVRANRKQPPKRTITLPGKR